MTIRQCWSITVVVLTIAISQRANADELYYRLPLRSLELVEGTLPADPSEAIRWRKGNLLRAMQPYVVLDGPGEAYVDHADGNAGRPFPQFWNITIDEAILSVCSPQTAEVTGRLFVPASDLSAMNMVRFRIPASSANPEGKQQFLRAKQAHYTALLDRNVAGAAWFRHQVRETRKALGETAAPETRPGMDFDPDFIPPRRNWRDNDDLASTYALFTGGRAMSENLQLDRIVATTSSATETATVDIESVEGISVQPMDWSSLVKDLKPEIDSLAKFVPDDQHAIFFPSFQAMVALADEAEKHGTPVLRLVEVRSENALTRQRYERQLGISLNGLSRAIGAQMIASVVITGSDPYYRTGTDVAVIFEAKNPSDVKALDTLLRTQASLMFQGVATAQAVQGKVGEISYAGFASPNREVSSYIATIKNAVIVTNSLSQLGRIVGVIAGESQSIVQLPEYIYFRNRYRKNDQDESALVFLSDATIRRWCGPTWRIATSRRMRQAAVMAELQATYLDELASNEATDGPIHTDLYTAGAEDLRLSPQGVWSRTYNTLNFLTPLIELPVAKITKSESDAYVRWRDTYQRNWRQYFDPIAIRLTVNSNEVSADITIMPLIAGSEYQQFIALTQDATIKPEACDPHDALAQAVMAINIRSQAGQQWGNFAAMMAPNLGMNPLDWLGQSISLFADPDPFWEKLAQTPDDQKYQFMETNQHRLPVALHAEVGDSLRLAAFLTALRAFAEQTAPGMLRWESLTHKDKPYVKVSATEQAANEIGVENLAIFYSASAKGFVLTFNEDLLKRSLDRQLEREASPAPEVESTQGPWLGNHLGLKVSNDAVKVVNALANEKTQETLRIRSWSNIPILNEWKHRYPNHDPLKLHEQYWQTRLECPGGGRYVWNEQDQTMESTAYGSPVKPKEGPGAPNIFRAFTFGDFGLTFEEQGLRARTKLRRK